MYLAAQICVRPGAPFSPASHAVQALAPARLYVALGHRSGCVAPAGQDEPAGHGARALLPVQK